MLSFVAVATFSPAPASRLASPAPRSVHLRGRTVPRRRCDPHRSSISRIVFASSEGVPVFELERQAPQVPRRSMLAFSAVLAGFVAIPLLGKPATAADKIDLALYENGPFKCSFKYPSSWSAENKSGAQVLIKDPDVRGGTIGLVANKVKASDLAAFGSPEVIADKTLKVELAKSGVSDARLIRTSSSVTNAGTLFYVIEYEVDSTRGAKHIISKIAIENYGLYILTAQYPVASFDQRAEVVDLVLDSFEIHAKS